jgi:alkanesulfonate monooxygenase SsuD/methylene tetrahydromethanopterin reductase-like flavin-dependent oxidoreductase (luciferase family)
MILTDILIFTLATATLGPTDAEAQAKLADYRRYADPEAALTLLPGWTGIDFSKLDLDQVVQHVENEAGRTALENITRADRNRTWSVRQAAEHVCIGGIGQAFVGSPATVAEQMEDWVEATGIDCFNLAFAVWAETFVDVADLLVPELQRRGRYKKAYREGALRQKLFGGSARLQPPHVGASHRWI